MNKAQLVDRIVSSIEVPKTQVEAILNEALDIIKKSVKSGDDVTLVGFGTFSKSRRQERVGRNPQTGAEITIPATTVPRFKPGKDFKETVQ